MDLRIENSSGKNVTLLTIAGGFYTPQDTLIKTVRLSTRHRDTC